MGFRAIARRTNGPGTGVPDRSQTAALEHATAELSDEELQGVVGGLTRPWMDAPASPPPGLVKIEGA